jgi:hypothetical protein
MWKYLDRLSFGDLAPLEEAGRVPSLVFSRMMVEDGRRLLSSNLDLRFLERVGGAFAIHDQKTLSSYGPYLSRPAVELRSTFKHAFPRFLVRTAVRLSA